MSRTKKTAMLRGFDAAVADIDDQLRLCHPLLSFEGDESKLYVPCRLDWHEHQDAWAEVDRSEASELATLLPEGHRWSVASGEGLVVAGPGFVQAATAAGILLGSSETSFTSVHQLACSIGTATQARFSELQDRLVDEARNVFDTALGNSVRKKCHLDERGTAALLILRRCGPRRREDLAVRQLAAARQDKDCDLYRRLLVRFELELESHQDRLHHQVERHLDLVAERSDELTYLYAAVDPLKHRFGREHTIKKQSRQAKRGTLWSPTSRDIYLPMASSKIFALATNDNGDTTHREARWQ